MYLLDLAASSSFYLRLVFAFGIKRHPVFGHPLSMKKLILLFLFAPALAAAAPPQFICFNPPGYSIPLQVQVFEYSSSCGQPVGSAENLGKKNGEAEVMCTYTAFCKPMIKDDDFDKAEIPKTMPAAQALMSEGARMAFVMCKGKATYKEGILCNAQGCPPVLCPGLTECQRDIHFNPVMGPLVSSDPVKTLVPKTQEVTR